MTTEYKPVLLYSFRVLSVNKQKEAQGMTAQNLTGYPSIDKPWLKYYTEVSINAPLLEVGKN